MDSSLIQRSVLTPPQLARRWGVSIEKIHNLIVRGELPGSFNAALQVGPGKRPRWKIPIATVDQFERDRAAVPAKRQDPEEVALG